MFPLMITGFYAGLFAFVMLALAARVIGGRIRAKVALGDGGDPHLLERIRAHANFTENVPMALLLVLLLEAGGAAAWFLHALGIALLTGRLVHAWAISAGSVRGRQVGMVLTFAVLAVAGAACLFTALKVAVDHAG